MSFSGASFSLAALPVAGRLVRGVILGYLEDLFAKFFLEQVV